MDLAELLIETDHRFVSGVPDSSLKHLCFEMAQHDSFSHIPAASEGSAVALAIGHWLATAKRPLVYMQNSGLPNALNPLLSLISTAAFDVPITLLIGWRGKPGNQDEPQHRIVGAQTKNMLEIANFFIVDIDERPASTLRQEVSQALADNVRVALLITPGINLSTCEPEPAIDSTEKMINKTELLSYLTDLPKNRHLLVGGIGHTSRQLMKLRLEKGQDTSLDLHCVGGMGFASNIAAGIAQSTPGTHVICLDGDGSFLMHGTSTSGFAAMEGVRLTHIVLVNGVHASVGGHPVCSTDVDYEGIARGVGYDRVTSAQTIDDIKSVVEAGNQLQRPQFAVAFVNKGDTQSLPRPSKTLRDSARNFHGLHFGP